MHEAAVAEPQYEVANARGRFRPQLLEYRLDQALIGLGCLRFRLVAHQCPFHGPVLCPDCAAFSAVPNEDVWQPRKDSAVHIFFSGASSGRLRTSLLRDWRRL